MPLLATGVRELPQRIGPCQAISGIMTDPGAPPVGDRPVFLFLNAGLLHKVGPSRMNVWLARHLAHQGIASMRFDASGIGDSATRDTPAGISDRSVGDVREAMGHLEALGVGSRFVLFGLCSGAEVAFEVALREPRVVGVVAIDGHVGRTWRFWVRHYLARLVRWESWRNRILGFSAHRTPAAAAAATRRPGEGSDAVGVLSRTARPKAEIARGLQALVDRNVRLLQIFTGGLEDRYNYRRQFLDAFPEVDFRDRLTLEFFSEADHTFTAFEAQRHLVRSIDRWAAGF